MLLARVLGIHCKCFGFKDVIYIYITEVLVPRMKHAYIHERMGEWEDRAKYEQEKLLKTARTKKLLMTKRT